MTKALEEEVLADLEAVEKIEEVVTEEQTTEDVVPEVVEQAEPEKEEGAQAEEQSTVADENRKKIEAYKARRAAKLQEEQKKAEAKQSLPQQQEVKQEDSPEDELKSLVEELRRYKKQQEFEQNIKLAERELNMYEEEFRKEITDYDEKVNDAIELTKIRLVKSGVSEKDAEEYVRREKILLADKAVAAGLDPVEAIYNEANLILSVYEEFAAKKGVKKAPAKTNLQALREASKPNALSSSSGRPTKAVQTTFDDMDLDDVHNLSIGDMMNGNFR